MAEHAQQNLLRPRRVPAVMILPGFATHGRLVMTDTELEQAVAELAPKLGCAYFKSSRFQETLQRRDHRHALWCVEAEQEFTGRLTPKLVLKELNFPGHGAKRSSRNGGPSYQVYRPTDSGPAAGCNDGHRSVAVGVPHDDATAHSTFALVPRQSVISSSGERQREHASEPRRMVYAVPPKRRTTHDPPRL